jgi:hypothetical protein
MSRSSIWRLRDAADIKPHRSVSWLTRPAPDFEAKAHDMGALDLNALRFWEQGRVVMCSDAKTGMQMLQRTYPTPPVAPGQPEKREPEDIRHGVRAWIASVVVATGHVVRTLGQTRTRSGRIMSEKIAFFPLGQTRTRSDFAGPLAQVVHQLPDRQRYDGVVDNRNTPWSLEVCRVVAQGGNVPLVAQDLHRGGQRRAFLSNPPHKHVVHFPPKHGAGLTQVAWGFRVLARRFLKRGDGASAHAFAPRLSDYLEVYNTHYALDVYGPTLGTRDAVQSHASSTTSWSGVV